MDVGVYTCCFGAYEYDAELRAGIGVSDNIARTTDGDVEETIATGGFSFGVTEQTSRLDLDFQSNADYLDYLDDTFDSEWVGGLVGIATIRIVEEKFEWIIEDTFGQQLLDPLQPSRPGNRENVNFFATGPRLTLRPGPRSPIVLDARYIRVNYEERPLDNERLYGSLSIGRDVSRDATLSVNLTAESAEFDDSDSYPDTDRYEAFVRYEKSGGSNAIAVDVGYNEVAYGEEEGDGVLARATWTKETSPRGTLIMSAGSRYSDQGNIFRSYQEISDDLRDTVDGGDTSSAPFQNYFFVFGYSLAHDLYSVDLSADWNQEDYEGNTGMNREIYRASLRFQRNITRRVFAGVVLRFDRREFETPDRRDDDLNLGLNLGYRLSPGTSLSFDYLYSQRDSTMTGTDFTENRAFVRIAYVPAWTR